MVTLCVTKIQTLVKKTYLPSAYQAKNLFCFYVLVLLTYCATTLWFQIEDMFKLIVAPKLIEQVKVQLKDTSTKVYAIG